MLKTMRPLQSYIPKDELLRQIQYALAEDIGDGDVTTVGALTAERRKAIVSADLVAKVDGVLAGAEIFSLVFQSVSEDVKLTFNIGDGSHFANDDILAHLAGPAAALLQAERTALNFIGLLSGISSLTARYVQAVAHTKCKILDTRKTTPGWRSLKKYAVNCGGAVNHRMGLFDMALIKENHISAAGSITLAVENIRDHLKDIDKAGTPIIVEVQNSAELKEALQVKVNRILLDNQSPSQLRTLVTEARALSPQTQLEASGNVTLANVAEYAETGVDFISVGALTHSAKVADFSLLMV